VGGSVVVAVVVVRMPKKLAEDDRGGPALLVGGRIGLFGYGTTKTKEATTAVAAADCPPIRLWLSCSSNSSSVDRRNTILAVLFLLLCQALSPAPERGLFL
jgi:hypothetical protein